MIIRREYRFKLKCDEEQRSLLNVYAGNNRFVWNYFLRLSLRRLEHGHRHEDNRLSQAVFSCQSCAHTDHADIVGAKNILRRGIAVNACGGAAQAGPMKQEPADSREQPHPLAACA